MGKNKFLVRIGMLSCAALVLGGCGTAPTSSAKQSSASATSSAAASSIATSSSTVTSSSATPSSVASSSSVVVAPSFSKASYSYDKNCGLAMELPLNLQGANLYYVNLDGGLVVSSSYSYDEAKACLVLNQDYLISLEKKAYTLSIITDADTENQATTQLTIMNSITTSFDTVTSKSYGYGKDKAISFNVDFSTATIASLKAGTRVIDPSYYSVTDHVFTIAHEAFDPAYKSNTYTLTLSNYDVYTFDIDSSVLFYSDYDTCTIHDATESHYGANPLYQWSDSTSVQIIDGTSFGFKGNVLKYTDNYTDNELNCHGFLTLRNATEWSASTWYDVGYAKTGNYFISFDYETVGTTTGDFAFKSWNSGYSTALAMGAANDNVLRHFETVLTGEQIGQGTMLWASFIGGSGYVLVDNFRVVSLGTPFKTLDAPDFSSTSSEDYSFDVDSNGYYFDVYDGTTKLDATIVGNKVTLPNAYMKTLAIGVHELTLKTLVGSYPLSLKVVDNTKAELVDTTYDYHEGTVESAVLTGSFSDGVTLSKLTEKTKTYSMDAAYTAAGWEFYHIDTTYDLSKLVTLTNGENGTGKLTLSLDFLNKAYGSSSFVAEFSNGKTAEFTITSDRLDVGDYDESTIWGSLNGTDTIASPFSSGMGNATYEIKEQSDGDKACYIYSTNGCADTCFYTFRTLASHPWAWYTLALDQNKLCRFRTNYIYKGLGAGEAYFKVIVEKSLDVAASFYGSDYTIDTANGSWNEVRFPLLNDGLEHTLDTGWFLASAPWGVMQLHLPSFAAAADTYVMFDDYVMSQTSNPVKDLSYKKDGSAFSFPLSYTLKKLTIGGTEVAFNQADGKVSVAASVMKGLSVGNQAIVATTNVGAFQASVSITAPGASLSETSKSFAQGATSVSLAGSFDSVTIASATKSGSHDYDYSKTTPQALDVSAFTLNSDSLVIGQKVLDCLYGTTTFTLTMNNGNILTFSLTATGKIFYDDFTNTTIWTTATGNVICCPDTSMVSFLQDTSTNSTYLLYEPSKATLSHANTNTLPYNGVLTCINPSHNRYGWAWMSVPFEDDKTYTISLSFNQTGASDSAYFAFYYAPVSGEAEVYERITANGTFSKDMKGSEIAGFCFLCKWSDETARSAFSCRINSLSIVEKA